MNIGTDSATYPVASDAAGYTIKVEVTVEDGTGDSDTRMSLPTTKVVGTPGQISRIEPGIRGITVSAGDNVMLSVDIYGLQDAKDNDDLGGTFTWSVNGDADPGLGDGREANFTAPSSPGKYTIVASLGAIDCDSDDENACSASIRGPGPTTVGCS